LHDTERDIAISFVIPPERCRPGFVTTWAVERSRYRGRKCAIV